MERDDSHVVSKEPCPKCGSRDNLGRYSDGHGYCFGAGCGYYEPAEKEGGLPAIPDAKGMLRGEVAAVPKRGITKETAHKFGYMKGELKGRKVQIAPYHDSSGRIVAQKIRDSDKNFTVLGESKKLSSLLFGANLWGTSGKRIVITEGEIDAMSVSQVQGNKWPVVSVPNGAAGAKKSIQKNIEYLEGFDEVVLMFDQDDAGKIAVQECAPLFSPGKCKVAYLPLKDANELLQQNRGQEIITAIWQAKEYRPDGIIKASDIKDEVLKPIEWGIPWFIEKLTQITYGRRYGEIYGIGAGTGIGKTDLLTQQIAFDISVLKEKVGTIFLEQKPIETVKRVAGKLKQKRFDVPAAGWEPEELIQATEEIGDSLVMYDSFGETEWSVVKAKIRFMCVSEGVRLIYLDHLTAMADTGDERGSLEQIMKELAGLAQELGCIITFVSHLATPEMGKPHEEGGRVTVRQFKGSRSIGFWSYYMFGLERNQQSDDESLRNVTAFRVLKDRHTGQATGQVLFLSYDQHSGMLNVIDKPEGWDRQDKKHIKTETGGRNWEDF